MLQNVSEINLKLTRLIGQDRLLSAMKDPIEACISEYHLHELGSEV